MIANPCPRCGRAPRFEIQHMFVTGAELDPRQKLFRVRYACRGFWRLFAHARGPWRFALRDWMDMHERLSAEAWNTRAPVKP